MGLQNYGKAILGCAELTRYRLKMCVRFGRSGLVRRVVLAMAEVERKLNTNGTPQSRVSPRKGARLQKDHGTFRDLPRRTHQIGEHTKCESSGTGARIRFSLAVGRRAGDRRDLGDPAAVRFRALPRFSTSPAPLNRIWRLRRANASENAGWLRATDLPALGDLARPERQENW